MHSIDDYVTVPQAAEILGVHRATIRKYVILGLLAPARQIGGSRLFLRCDVESVVKPRRGRPYPHLVDQDQAQGA